MKTLSFVVDHNLYISEWGVNIEVYTGQSSPEVIGKKYYDVLPRLCTEVNDAIVEAIHNKKSFHFEKYNFNCLHCSIEADITITHLNGSAGDNKIQVLINPLSGCCFREDYIKSQGFIGIGKIASSLAHGVRNPLNALKGAVVYLEEKYKDEAPLIEFTQIMSEEIARLDNFISKFLSTSISGNDITEIDINTLIKKIEVLVSLQTKAKNIKTDFKYGVPPRIKVNSFQAEQAILNVINNAIEAMDQGGCLIVSTAMTEKSKKTYAVIEISDTGPGISHNNVIGSTMNVSRTGRGLGMFITNEVLRYYHGHIDIKSKYNDGSTIKLFFPSQGHDA